MYIHGHKIGLNCSRRSVGLSVLIIVLFILLLNLFFVDPVRGETAVAAPRGVLANGVDGNIVISWEPVKGAYGYEIFEKSPDDEEFLKVKRTRGTKAVLPNHTRKKVYVYKIRTIMDGPGKKIYSSFSREAVTSTAPAGSRTTLKNFLTTAMAPVGNTMYIWGGGWYTKWKNKGSDGAWIGLNPTWRSYAAGRPASFNYRRVRYKTGYGLDCSGFVGWVTYNTMKTQSAVRGRGFVGKSTLMAKRYAGYGWGSYRKAALVRNYRAGDIMSTSGHVYIVIGECDDGSVVLVHASPPGVQLCGTVSGTGSRNSQAVKLARKYREKYYKSWQKRFPSCVCPPAFLRKYNQFRWNLSSGNIMSDPDGYRNMVPEEILRDLFE